MRGTRMEFAPITMRTKAFFGIAIAAVLGIFIKKEFDKDKVARSEIEDSTRSDGMA